jgi:hypothetical protein
MCGVVFEKKGRLLQHLEMARSIESGPARISPAV